MTRGARAFAAAEEAFYRRRPGRRGVVQGSTESATPPPPLCARRVASQSLRGDGRGDASPSGPGADVCAAFYGHPGVFVYPGHEAIAAPAPRASAPACCPASRPRTASVRPRHRPGARRLQSYEATISSSSAAGPTRLPRLSSSRSASSGGLRTWTRPTGRGCPSSIEYLRSTTRPSTR